MIFNTYDQEQIGIPVKTKNAEWIEPLPHLLCFFRSLESVELGGSLDVDGFGLHEEAESYRGAGQGSLEPENITPATEGDDDTSDKWT